MDITTDSESGFLGEADLVGGYGTGMTDIEVISVSGSHVLASGKRYGRLWMLKGLRSELRQSTLHRQQLAKEFEIASRLRHPGIVETVSMEEFDSLGPCIVMERIDGLPLSQYMQQPVSRRRRRQLALEIVRAVAHLHSAGIAHRDLKPANIMVRRNGGHAVIIDMGMADDDSYALLKNPGGTAGYMSAEQQEKAVTDVSNDVYSLGVILLGLYPPYSRIARRCMQPAGRRYANADELLAAMEAHGRRRSYLRYAAVAVVAAAALAAGYSEISRLQTESQTNVTHIAALNDTVMQLRQRLTRETTMRHAEQARRRILDEAIAYGRSNIDSVFAIYSRRRLDPADMKAFALQIERMRVALRATADRSVAEYDSRLSENDRILMASAIEQYLTQTFQQWMQKTTASGNTK